MHIHDFRFKLFKDIIPALLNILEKLLILILPLPFFMVFLGTQGIIEENSPDNLANFNAMSSGFFDSLGMHALIILGALGITLIIWFITRKIWRNSEQKSGRMVPEESTSEEHEDNQ
jgi:hypothetical protein